MAKLNAQSLIPGDPTAARKQLAAFEWACLGLVTLGYGAQGARLPRPRRYAGVLLTFAILGLVSDMGRAAARLAGAMGGTLTLALLLNATVSQRLIGAPSEHGKGGFLGTLAGWFGTEPDPPPAGIAVDTFGGIILGYGGAFTAPPGGQQGGQSGGGGGGGAW